MDRPLFLTAPSEPRVRLRAAGTGDLELLRAWKNANKAGFFFKGDITPAMQSEWFEAYRKRPDDFMFVVEYQGEPAGCMGYRVVEGGAADTYNMIAAPGSRGKGIMKKAMIMMCSYIAKTGTRDVGCLVVKGNEALKYYERCGYRVVRSERDREVLKVDWSRLKEIPVDASEKSA